MLKVLECCNRYRVDPSGKIINRDTYGHVMPFDQDGYLYVVLTDYEGQNKKYRLHRLIAQTYIPNPNNLPQVNHIDGNKYNNDVSNLEWCSAKENTAHALQTGLRSGYMPVDQKVSLLKRKESGETIRSLAKELNMDEKQLASILRRFKNSIKDLT